MTRNGTGQWIPLIISLYGGLDEHLHFTPERMHRDSPLTTLFLSALQHGSRVGELLPDLRQIWSTSSDEIQQADALVALTILGEESIPVLETALADTTRQAAASTAISRLGCIVKGTWQALSKIGKAVVEIAAVLVPFLDEQERYELLATLLNSIYITIENEHESPETWPATIQALVPYLNAYPDLLEKLVAMTEVLVKRAANSSAYETLTALIPCLETHPIFITQLLSMAQSLPVYKKEYVFRYTYESPRLTFLAQILPCAQETERANLLHQVLMLSEGLFERNRWEKGDWWLEILKQVAPSIVPAPELLSQTLQFIELFPDRTDDRCLLFVKSLQILLPFLGEKQKRTALNTAFEVMLPPQGTPALAALVTLIMDSPDLLHEQQTQQALFTALETMSSTVDPLEDILVLAELAPLLKPYPGLLQKAFGVFQTLRNNVASSLSSVMFESYQDEIQTDRQMTLGHLSGRVGFLKIQFQAAKKKSVLLITPDTWTHFPPLEMREWVPCLDGVDQQQIIRRALQQAQALEGPLERAYALLTLLPYLDEKDLYATCALLLSMLHTELAMASLDSDHRLVAFVELIQYLQRYPDLWSQTPEVISSLGIGAGQDIKYLAPHIAHIPDLLKELLRIAQSLPAVSERIDEVSPRIMAVVALAPFLEEKEQHEALGQILSLVGTFPANSPSTREDRNVSILKLLLPPLACFPDLLAQALQLAQSLPMQTKDIWGANMYPRAYALAALVPYLNWDTDVVSQLTTAIDGIEDTRAYAAALASLSSYFAVFTDIRDRALHVVRMRGNVCLPFAILDRTIFHFTPPLNSEKHWLALEARHHQEKALQVLQRSFVLNSKLSLSIALRLDKLLRSGNEAPVRVLLPQFSQPEEDAVAIVEGWLQQTEPMIANQAALLLAEAGYLSPQILPGLIALLQGDDDRAHCRIIVALTPRYSFNSYHVSTIGRETVEALAHAYLEHVEHPQIGTILKQSLAALEYDDVTAAEHWARSVERGMDGAKEAALILQHMRQVSQAVGDMLLQKIRLASTTGQARLVQHLLGLLRSAKYFLTSSKELRLLLLTVQHSQNEQVRCFALEAIGQLREAGSTALLLEALTDVSPAIAHTASMTLARLARSMNEEEKTALEQELILRLSNSSGNATVLVNTLTSIWIEQVADQHRFSFGLHQEEEKRHAFQALLQQITRTLYSIPEGQTQPDFALRILLGAGSDEDAWEYYHDEVVGVICSLLENDDSLFTNLLNRLKDALVRAYSWPERRIHLAVGAAMAERSPAAFARAVDTMRIEDLLLQALEDFESEDIRRFALTMLSYLRRITRKMIGGLHAAMRDVEKVQRDALQALAHFRRVDEDLIAGLIEGLYHPVTSIAYVNGRLLAVLGRSEGTRADLGQRIVEALATAVRDDRSHREVYIFSQYGSIDHIGSLQQTFYNAILYLLGMADTNALEGV